MRLLHIITGLADGGAEAVLYRLCLATRDVTHVVVALGPAGKYGPLLQAAGIETHALDMPRGRLTAAGLIRLYRLVRAQRPDIVQTWMYHANLVGGLVAWLARSRTICWGLHHARLIAGTTGASTRTVDWLSARLSGFVPRLIVACAEQAREVHIAMGYAAAKFVVVPNGYDTTVFNPDAAARSAVRREIAIAPEAPVIGLVGRWDALKDHENLLRASARVAEQWPALHVVLAGTGCTPDNAALNGLVSQLGLASRTHLLGQRSDVPAIMNALDLHVLSSVGEAFPNVVAEAMASGTPCVVTDVGDAALIVGETGWVVPPRDPAALATAVAAALDASRDRESWAGRRQAARQRIIESFSLARMVERYRDVWASLLPTGPR